MKHPTRIRLLTAAHDAAGRPSMWKAVVMHGAKVVASTSNMRNERACLCVAETLRATYNVTQRAQ